MSEGRTHITWRVIKMWYMLSVKVVEETNKNKNKHKSGWGLLCEKVIEGLSETEGR